MSNRLLSPALRLAAGGSLSICLALIAAGCGSSGPTMGRVSGVVTHGGAPLTKGNVTFVPDDPDAPYATGQIGPDGSYTLATSEFGDGAVVGSYKVAISGLGPEDVLDYIPPDASDQPQSPISLKYADVNTSGLTATVERGSNTFNFDLE
ncbi:hypothetical protein [Tautonia sociabilis]|uniref:Carboxypeptidase regulatory-like domain-containing protein n=1 Tax=Tautonia sociabilis TaxID=2080755 RepID=A0A432MH14_9BACT|nr:hypothetical protein [Tautonia sociabilis]RUL86269.1 hypothetical protein TsocGM_16175 [Tautonia sociabilis]